MKLELGSILCLNSLRSRSGRYLLSRTQVAHELFALFNTPLLPSDMLNSVGVAVVGASIFRKSEKVVDVLIRLL